MLEQSAVVAVYATHIEAESAVKELQRAGIDMRTLSIVGKDTHADEHVVGYYNTGDRMKYWGKAGAFWGGFWGLLFGSAFFAIPGLGPVLVAGPLVAAIVGGLEEGPITDPRLISPLPIPLRLTPMLSPAEASGMAT